MKDFIGQELKENDRVIQAHRKLSGFRKPVRVKRISYRKVILDKETFQAIDPSRLIKINNMSFVLHDIKELNRDRLDALNQVIYLDDLVVYASGNTYGKTDSFRLLKVKGYNKKTIKLISMEEKNKTTSVKPENLIVVTKNITLQSIARHES